VTGLDNINFLSKDQLGVVEDAGDGLHASRNALDSGYSFDVNADYSNPQNQPVRWIAEGRDPSATIDSATGGFGKNEGDNELTGYWSRTAIPVPTASSGRRTRTSATASGAGSTPSSTATTRRGKCSSTGRATETTTTDPATGRS
jgi:hypothetical protein